MSLSRKCAPDFPGLISSLLEHHGAMVRRIRSEFPARAARSVLSLLWGNIFCGAFNRLHLTSDGKLRSCLVRPNEVSLREAVRNGKPLDEYFIQAVQGKLHHYSPLAIMPADSHRRMSQIGG